MQPRVARSTCGRIFCLNKLIGSLAEKQFLYSINGLTE